DAFECERADKGDKLRYEESDEQNLFINLEPSRDEQLLPEEKGGHRDDRLYAVVIKQICDEEPQRVRQAKQFAKRSGELTETGGDKALALRCRAGGCAAF